MPHRYQPTQGEHLWPESLQQYISYREYPPSPELSPYVACFWVIKSLPPLPYPVLSRVIPDGCIDIVIDLQDVSKGGSGKICGLMHSASVSYITGSCNLIGVRFWPIGATRLLHIPASDFTDTLVPLPDVWGVDATLLCEEILQAASDELKLRVLQRSLKSRLATARVPDHNVEGALKLIIRDGGLLEVRDVARELYISQRHLTRKFTDWIGTNPKTFCTIVRFQNVIGALSGKDAHGFSEVINIGGYYDQSHFIKEFKAFYGLTPGCATSMSDLYNPPIWGIGKMT